MTRHVIATKATFIILTFLNTLQAQNASPNLLSARGENLDSSYTLDSNYTIQGAFPNPLAYTRIGIRVLSDETPKETILQFNIQSITVEGDYTKKYDKNGNVIYEKWHTESHDFFSDYVYTYNKNNAPLSIAVKATYDNIFGIAKYKYDITGKLLQAGEYIFKYYPDGLLKSVEDERQIERYQYDSSGNLTQIKFDIKPGRLVCGNRTEEWKGNYNKNKQLIKEEEIGIEGSVRYFQYDIAGHVIKSINQYEGSDEDSTTEYIYTNGLLTEKITSSNGKVINSKKYLYQFY